MTVRTRGEETATLPRPTADRLRKPSWRDTRLVVGVGLIALATAAGAMVISSFDDSVEVYAASGELVPGQQLTRSDVRTVKVRMDDVGGEYLPADQKLPTGRIVRAVGSGELIPSGAIGAPSKTGVKSITVQTGSASASTLVRGSVVDVWVSKKQGGQGAEYSPPERMVERAMVAQVPGAKSGPLSVSGGENASVQLLIPDGSIDRVIDAVNTDARITLVAAADSPLKSGS